MEEKEKLFSEFPPLTAADWEARIIKDLDGADYTKKLVRKTSDNITIKPYYTADDLSKLEYLEQVPGCFPYVRGDKKENNKWEIRQDFKIVDTDNAIEKIHLAQSRGATSVGVDVTSAGELQYHDFRKLIKCIDPENTELNFITSDSAPQILEYLLKALNELKRDRKTFRGSLGYDPLGYLASTGGFIYSERDDFKNASEMITRSLAELPGLRVLSVNSNIFGDSGATATQELAYGLSMISEYMSSLTEMGVSAENIAATIQWNLSIGSDYFIEIAKVRAARMLFSTLLSAFTSAKKPVYINSITSRWNKTVYDPNVNLLRLTTEAMSAILGGCDSLLVQPYDVVYNEPTDFSERLARNIQIILKEESYFDKVIDPASGSYYIESLTDSLIRNSWDMFLAVDEKGGFIKAFTEGYIQKEIESVSTRRKEMVAQRREALLGTNQYPNMNESVTGCITDERAFGNPKVNSYKIAEPVVQGRASAEFEKLRLGVERQKGKRPRVFLLTHGNLAMRLARAQFSANFFGCAGYEVIDNLGFKTVEEGIDSALKAEADIVVLCSSDDEYLNIAPVAAERAGEKAIIVVAGAPATMEELKQKGITEFIHIRSNVLETLRSFHNKLGIEI